MTMNEALSALGLSITAAFVPWSESRNYDAKATPDKRSLNWKITVMLAHPDMSAPVGQDGERPRRAPVPVLITDYMAGVGHCPSYKQGARWTLDYTRRIEAETEAGRAINDFGIAKGKPITPKAADVLACLAMDASALDYATFEQWASDMGYDPDSRKGEAIYRQCLETALKLRNALGESGLATLRNAAADY